MRARVVRPNHWSPGSREFGGDVGLSTSDWTGCVTPASTICSQAGDVDGQHEVGGRAVAFGLQALDHALVDEGHVDGDPGFGGEGVDEGLDQFGLAVGVDVDLSRQRRGGRRGGRGAGGGVIG